MDLVLFCLHYFGTHCMCINTTGCPMILTPFNSDFSWHSKYNSTCYYNICPEYILSFKMKVIWSKSTTNRKLWLLEKIIQICLVRSCVFYIIENQKSLLLCTFQWRNRTKHNFKHNLLAIITFDRNGWFQSDKVHFKA